MSLSDVLLQLLEAVPGIKLDVTGGRFTAESKYLYRPRGDSE